MLYIVKRIIDIFIRVEEVQVETQRVRKSFMAFDIGFRDFIPAIVVGVLIIDFIAYEQYSNFGSVKLWSIV